MADNIAVFVDVSNLYYNIGRVHNKKLDYEQYLVNVIEGMNLYRATAYGSAIGVISTRFLSALKNIGFELKYREAKKSCWNIGIAVDVIRIMDSVDTILLGTASPEMAPLVEYVCERDKKCVVVACDIHDSLCRAASDTLEIPEEWLI